MAWTFSMRSTWMSAGRGRAHNLSPKVMEKKKERVQTGCRRTGNWSVDRAAVSLHCGIACKRVQYAYLQLESCIPYTDQAIFNEGRPSLSSCISQADPEERIYALSASGHSHFILNQCRLFLLRRKDSYPRNAYAKIQQTHEGPDPVILHEKDPNSPLVWCAKE